MRRTRVGLLALFSLVALTVAVDPALAQSTADSNTEEAIWELNSQLLYVAVPITVLVEGILIYTVWKFRNNESPLPTKENRRLEITWTVATAIILLFVGVASYQVLAQPYVAANTADGPPTLDDGQELEEIQVIAQKYSWTFKYPGENVTTTQTMVMPADQPVRLNVTSRDWLHALHVPGLGLKQDAFPGQSSYLITTATETGTHQLYCAEYCGVGHSGMLGTVEVRSQGAYQDWLDEQSPGATNESMSDMANATSG